MTTFAVSDKCIHECLSISRSLQDLGLVCWDDACLVWSPESCDTAAQCSCGALESKSHQQLEGCMAATVWAARHHSNSPMHHLLSPLAAWKPHQCTRAWSHRLTLKRRNMFIRNQWGMSISWNGIWLKYGQQPAELHWSIDRSVTRLFYCVSQSKHFEHLLWCVSLWYVTVITFKAYITWYCFYEQTDLCFISQGRLRTAARRGGQFWCSSAANLFQYVCAKNSKSTVWCGKIIAKMKGCNFLHHSVEVNYYVCQHSACN